MLSLLSSLRRYAVWIGVGVFVVGGGWWYTHRGNGEVKTLTVHIATSTAQVSVSGTVKPAQNVDLGFVQSGRVGYVGVTVGDTAVQDSVIASLDNADLQAAVAQKQAIVSAKQAAVSAKQAALDTQKAKLASLLAGTRPESIAVSQAQVTSDQTALAQANQSTIDAMNSAYTASEGAVHNTVDQLFNNPRTPNPTLVFNDSDQISQSAMIADRVAIDATLASWQKSLTGLTPDQELSNTITQTQGSIAAVTRILIDANTALNNAVAGNTASVSSISGWVTAVGAARTSVATAQTAFTTAVTARKNTAALLDKDQKSLTLAIAGPIQSDIDAQKAMVAAAQADISTAQADTSTAQADLGAAKANLVKTYIVAPFTGTVTIVNAKVGQSAAANTQEISMISSGTFQIETYVPEVNIAAVQVGNAADVTLDAYGSDVHFSARVISIDPAQTTMNGIATYKTTLQFSKAENRIRPGMTAGVVIATSINPHAIVVPEGVVYAKDGKQFVQVLQGKTVQVREVHTVSTGRLGEVQVVSGLSDSEQVVVTPDASL